MVRASAIENWSTALRGTSSSKAVTKNTEPRSKFTGLYKKMDVGVYGCGKFNPDQVFLSNRLSIILKTEQ